MKNAPLIFALVSPDTIVLQRVLRRLWQMGMGYAVNCQLTAEVLLVEKAVLLPATKFATSSE